MQALKSININYKMLLCSEQSSSVCAEFHLVVANKSKNKKISAFKTPFPSFTVEEESRWKSAPSPKVWSQRATSFLYTLEMTPQILSHFVIYDRNLVHPEIGAAPKCTATRAYLGMHSTAHTWRTIKVKNGHLSLHQHRHEP
jgi:hypothetical protein